MTPTLIVLVGVLIGVVSTLCLWARQQAGRV